VGPSFDLSSLPRAWLHGTLLSLHLLGVVVWIGAGLYDLFLDREIERARGTPAEVVLARVYVRYGPVIVAAVFVVAATGALQTWLFGFGWLGWSWLGAKQVLMGVVLAVLFGLFPSFARMSRAVSALPVGAAELSGEARQQLARVRPWLVVIRACAITALLLAAFRP